MPSYASARELMDAVMARYRALPDYSDRGFVTARRRGRDHVIVFETAYEASGDFRFTFDRPHPYRPLRHVVTRFVVGRRGGEAYLDRRASDGDVSTQVEPDFNLAIAGATGTSYGAAHTIAGLLFPEVTGWSFRELKRPRLRSPQLIDGVWCHRITGLQHRARMVIHVGVEDLLIRRIADRRPGSEERRLDVRVSAPLSEAPRPS